MTSVIVSKSKVVLPRLIFVKICGVLCIHTPWAVNPPVGAIIQYTGHTLCYNITIPHECGRPSNPDGLPRQVVGLYIDKPCCKPHVLHLSVVGLLLLYVYVFMYLLFLCISSLSSTNAYAYLSIIPI